MKDLPIIMGLAFGVRPESSGKSNEEIGSKIEKFIEKNKQPIIVQEEVALTLSDDLENPVEVIPGNLPWKDRGNYGDTHDVAVKAKKIAERNNWGRDMILVCHPAHAWRAEKIFKKQAFKVIVPQEGLKDIPYDWNSYYKQPWTKSKWLWWPKELLISIPLDKVRGYY